MACAGGAAGHDRLRVSEAININVTDLRAQAGYELLTVMGKGAKPSLIPLPVPVLRAVREPQGPQCRAAAAQSTQRAPQPTAAAGRLRRLARQAGLSQQLSPRTLRRTFCTAGLISGVPLRNMQYAMRHAGSRTTLRYGMARADLERHAAQAVAAYLAGISAD